MSELPALQERDYTRQRLSLAPMIDKTDRDWRWIMRQITKKTLMYTEMITAPAVLRGKQDKLLAFDPSEKPLVLQLGWDEPEALAESCRIAEDYGYDEINLNCGCPSDKVQQHDFGACLMARPEHVAHLVESMAEATVLPVTVKNRIGIRSRKTGLSLESYENLRNFVNTVSEAGCRKFIVHARIAVLEGLSPRQNRDVPPLRPDDVYKLKEEFPELFIEINGGYKTADEIDAALKYTDAVMLGRAALDNPWMLSQADRLWFGSEEPAPTRRKVLEAAVPYMIDRAESGASRGHLIQPLMNLFAGERGAKAWKRTLTDLPSAGADGFGRSLVAAVAGLDSSLLDGPPS